MLMGIFNHRVFQKGFSTNFPEGASLNMQTPMSSRKSKIIRKDTIGEVVDKGKLEVLDHLDGNVVGFCEMFDDYLERA
jgi:hypothetical protein